MSSIFDQQDDELNEFEAQSQESFTLEFGVETVDVPIGQFDTVASAFRAKADYLGFNFDQTLTYRDDDSNLLEGGELPEVGRVYTAAITHDTKGF